MKICFFLQRRFAFLGNVMATNIKSIAPETEFCGVVHSRTSYEYITTQKDIAYTDILFDEEVHDTLYGTEIDYDYLKWLESEYGIPNLWPYLYIDRIVMNGQFLREYPYDKPALSRDDMLRCIQVNAKAIIAFLEKEKPSAVVFSVVGSVVSTLLYHIAQKKGIQTINIDFARIGNRIALSEIDGTLTWVQKRFKEIQDGRATSKREDAKKFLEEFRGAPAPYDLATLPELYEKTGRSVALRFLSPKKLLWSIPWHTKTIVRDLKKIQSSDYTHIFIWWSLWDKLKRKVRTLRGFSDLYEMPIQGERFAYYPLHIEPEIALMRYAPYYTNQIEVIRATAHALPLDMYLYVKEHPGMVGFRTRAYYEQLRNIPNVRVIDPHVSGGELARAAALTVTVTSTGAWEALILKRPVITFGDVFFNDIPGVKRCRSLDELPYMVKEQLEKWTHDEAILVNYVCALLEDSVAVNFSQMWNDATALEVVQKDKGMFELSRVLAEKVGAIKVA